MKNELRIFFTALMFYTRIPCPAWVGHDPEYINKSTRYFPFIGWIVGLFAGAVLVLSLMVFPVTVAVVLSMISSILLTGAFHEDGFADVCDGFGGGWTDDNILDIMKDSRVGAFGMIGMVLLLLLKWTLTVELTTMWVDSWIVLLLIIIVAHSLSRCMASLMIFILPYVQKADKSKVKPVSKSMSAPALIIGSITGLLPLIFLSYLLESWILLITLLPTLLMLFYLAGYFKKWIGGYTGDCLGATQQVTEIIILASLAGLWKFI